MLPLLVVLFLLSYGLMTMLIVVQGSTIESQRALIRDLFNDSVELSSYKGRALAEKKMAAQHKAQTQAPVAKSQSPATQSPSVQTPSTQTQQNQAPSSQVAPQHRTQGPGKARPQFQHPSRPAADLADDRRALITI